MTMLCTLMGGGGGGGGKCPTLSSTRWLCTINEIHNNCLI